MVIQPRMHFRYISNTHSSTSRRREAELTLELDVVGLLKTKPLLVCEQSAETAVAESNGFIGTQLLRFERIFGCPVEARADLVQASRSILEISTDPLLGGVGAGARVVVIEILQRQSDIPVSRAMEVPDFTYWASCTSVERIVKAFALDLKLKRGIARPFETKEAGKEVLQMQSVHEIHIPRVHRGKLTSAETVILSCVVERAMILDPLLAS